MESTGGEAGGAGRVRMRSSSLDAASSSLPWSRGRSWTAGTSPGARCGARGRSGSQWVRAAEQAKSEALGPARANGVDGGR